MAPDDGAPDLIKRMYEEHNVFKMTVDDVLDETYIISTLTSIEEKNQSAKNLMRIQVFQAKSRRSQMLKRRTKSSI